MKPESKGASTMNAAAGKIVMKMVIRISMSGLVGILILSMACMLHASGADDLNTNPRANNLLPYRAGSWPAWAMAHNEANDLMFHIKVLKLLNAGAYAAAIRILEKELVEKGDHLKTRRGHNKAGNEYEKNIEQEIRTAIEAFDAYRKRLPGGPK